MGALSLVLAGTLAGLLLLRLQPRSAPGDPDVASLTPPPFEATAESAPNDALFYENQSFVLQLIEGQRLRGAWMKDSPEPLRNLWGQDVLIEGILQFKPNGEPLALEAEVITQAADRDRFWSNIPKPKPKATRKPTKPHIRPSKNPWDLVVGIWPGTESEDEFAALVEEMS